MTRRRWPPNGSCCAPARALGEAVAQALGELEQGRGAVAALRAAHRLVERNVDKAAGRLDASLAALDRALSEATEAQAQLETARDALEFDPGAAGEDRGAAVRAARRRPQAQRRRARARAARREDGRPARRARRRRGRPEEALAGEAKAARAAYVAAAEAQAAARRKGAARLDKAVVGRARPAQAREGEVRHRACARLPEADWSEAGTDRVQFTVATNPGTPPAPIAQDRLGRRAVALPAGAQGLPRQGGRRRDDRVRRGRLRASAAPPRRRSASG